MTEIPQRLLNSPTIGALRRARGETGPCLEARHSLAVAIVHEAIYRIVLDRLDSIFRGFTRDPQRIAASLRRLADDIDPPAGQHEHGAAA